MQRRFCLKFIEALHLFDASKEKAASFNILHLKAFAGDRKPIQQT
jgi:hypothetical protein